MVTKLVTKHTPEFIRISLKTHAQYHTAQAD